MSTVLQLVLSNPIAGMEDEFNHWYGGDHLLHGVLTPGVLAGQRFERAAGPWPAGRHGFLMIWEIGEPAYTLAELAKVKGTQAMPISPALDFGTVQPPTMWRRAIINTSARISTESSARGPLIFGLYKANDALDLPLADALLSGGLAKIADSPGVRSAEYLTLAEEQIRGNCRKYPHGLLIELHDEATAIASLKEILAHIPHANGEDFMAIVFHPVGLRKTKQEAQALRSHALEA